LGSHKSNSHCCFQKPAMTAAPDILALIVFSASVAYGAHLDSSDLVTFGALNPLEGLMLGQTRTNRVSGNNISTEGTCKKDVECYLSLVYPLEPQFINETNQCLPSPNASTSDCILAIFQDVCSNLHKDNITNMYVVARNGTYRKPNDMRSAYASNPFGILSVATGTRARIDFVFIHRATMTLKTFSSVYFSFFDFDHFKGDRERIDVEASFTSYEVRNGSSLSTENVSTADLGRALRIESSDEGDHNDNPNDALTLTAGQANKSISFLFENINTIRVSLETVHRGDGARTGARYIFSGISPLVCDENFKIPHAPCNVTPVPTPMPSPGPVPVPPPPTPAPIPGICVHNVSCDLRLSKYNMLINNLDGNVTGPREMLFEDVCVGSKMKMNLVIKATSNYTSGRPARMFNAAAGKVVSIALMSDSFVNLHFTFFERGDEQRVPVFINSFYFSVLDMDVGGMPLESVGLTGFTSATVVDGSALTDTVKGRWVHFSSSSQGSDVHSDLNAMDLSESQQKHSVSFLYTNTSDFPVKLNVSSGGGGRRFLLTGKTSLVCKPIPVQECCARRRRRTCHGCGCCGCCGCTHGSNCSCCAH